MSTIESDLPVVTSSLLTSSLPLVTKKEYTGDVGGKSFRRTLRHGVSRGVRKLYDILPSYPLFIMCVLISSLIHTAVSR